MNRPDLRLARRGGWIELLRAPALLFGAAARTRGLLYDRGLFRAQRADAAVISVGNLSVGGTGKTPMIAWLARELRARGATVGILSRGYGASDGAPNDEAVMLAEDLPDVDHVQDRDRVRGARLLASRGVDVILVDDGFQHRRLARDVDIVLMDALRPFGLPVPASGGEPVRAFLPRGLMREPLAALRRADAVVITRAEDAGPATLGRLKELAARWAPGVPVALATHAPVRLRPYVAGAENDAAPESLAGCDVDLFSGIGNPGAFERTVKSLGAIVHEHRVFPDHYLFSGEDLAGLGTKRAAVTTAKDAARLRTASVPAPPALRILDVELVIGEGRAHLCGILDDFGSGGSHVHAV